MIPPLPSARKADFSRTITSVIEERDAVLCVIGNLRILKHKNPMERSMTLSLGWFRMRIQMHRLTYQ
jgi:uncharacterized protein (UPF0264 family)